MVVLTARPPNTGGTYTAGDWEGGWSNAAFGTGRSERGATWGPESSAHADLDMGRLFGTRPYCDMTSKEGFEMIHEVLNLDLLLFSVNASSALLVLHETHTHTGNSIKHEYLVACKQRRRTDVQNNCWSFPTHIQTLWHFKMQRTQSKKKHESWRSVGQSTITRTACDVVVVTVVVIVV